MKTGDHAGVDVESWREAARAYLALDVLPRYDVVKSHSTTFSRGLWALIDAIKYVAATRPDEIVAQVAMASVGEACRRLTVIERAGLMGEHERVIRLARSVQALCDHFETLTEVTMCLACDQKIEATDETLPYNQLSPSDGASQPGLIHTRCATAGRPPR